MRLREVPCYGLQGSLGYYNSRLLKRETIIELEGTGHESCVANLFLLECLCLLVIESSASPGLQGQGRCCHSSYQASLRSVSGGDRVCEWLFSRPRQSKTV